jgi:hypothetical protein
MVVKSPNKGEYFDPAHPTTKKMYDDAKFQYPITADEKALELKMDKLRTMDGVYNFKSEVVRLCRYMDEDGKEWVDTEEVITGRSSIGNLQEYWSRVNYSHDEPDINKIATLQSGEQIIVTGDYIKHVKRVFELPWEDFKADKDGCRTKIMERARDGNPNKIILRVEGVDLPHPYSLGTYKKAWDMWFDYNWQELSDYCTKGYKVGDLASLEKIFNKLTPEQKTQLKARIKA